MWGSGGGGLGGYVLALRCTAPLTGHGDAIFGNSTVSNRKSRASRLTAVAKRSWLGRAIWATGACGLIGLDWVRNAPHASHARPAARHSDSALSSRSQSRLHAQARLALPRLASPCLASLRIASTRTNAASHPIHLARYQPPSRTSTSSADHASITQLAQSEISPRRQSATLPTRCITPKALCVSIPKASAASSRRLKFGTIRQSL